MWSQVRDDEVVPAQTPAPARDKLLLARQQMKQALALLDSHSGSAAAASLDLAVHQLDRELAGK